jgi:ethanolamine ammonia-lyase small subunit
MTSPGSRDFAALRRATPARLGAGRAGPRPTSASQLEFRADHARARDAVRAVWSEAFLEKLRSQGFLFADSAAPDAETYLRRPDLGRQLAAGEAERIRACARPGAVAQLVLSGGLSARAAELHFAALWPVLARGLERLGPLAAPVAVLRGRVALADRICEASGAQLAVHLIGERPGLATPHSLGCYLTLRPTARSTDADRKCLSNIHLRGLPPDEAGAAIAELAARIAAAGTSGTELGL